MSNRIRIEQRALKTLKVIPSQDRQRIRFAIRALAEEPRPQGCKKLTDSNDWRIRVGRMYRVVYRIEEKQLLVVVLRIGHRRYVYR